MALKSTKTKRGEKILLNGKMRCNDGQRGDGSTKRNVIKQTKPMKVKEALDLRRKGLTYDQIAVKLNCSVMWAHGLVKDGMKEVCASVRETATEIRDIEVRRLDGILEKLWGRRGDPRVSDTILRLMDRRAKLLGLDAANKTEVHVEGLENLTDEQITERIEAIVQSARARGDGFPSGGTPEAT